MIEKTVANATIRALYGGMLTPGRVAELMMSAEEYFPTVTVRRGNAARALQHGTPLQQLQISGLERDYDLVDYLALNRVTGLLVLKGGEIVREDYELGLTPSTRHASFSLAKSICSTLVGCALADGYLASLDQPLSDLLPELQHSAYADVSLRALLSMRTGIAWDETYTQPNSDRRRFLDSQLERQPGALLAVMASLQCKQPISKTFNYSTGETFLVGAVLEAKTGRSLADYLSERLWQPLGMEHEARWWLESPSGAGMGGSGLSATLRDYGRFAQFILDGGMINGHRLVPENWFDEATQPQPDGVSYGYQWWLPSNDDVRHTGAFMGMGIFGQRMYINPKHQLVAVVLAARSKPSNSHVISDEAFFASLVEACAR
jgi:CubicO group peptidase (beta-lactamase class C family)